jgi:hypothetical protein
VANLPRNYKEVLQAELSWLQREVDLLNGPETEDGFGGDITRAQEAMAANLNGFSGIARDLASGAVQFSELQKPIRVQFAPFAPPRRV